MSKTAQDTVVPMAVITKQIESKQARIRDILLERESLESEIRVLRSLGTFAVEMRRADNETDDAAKVPGITTAILQTIMLHPGISRDGLAEELKGQFDRRTVMNNLGNLLRAGRVSRLDDDHFEVVAKE